MKLKVCGMKYSDNIVELSRLQPDYMGFIFYEKSRRFHEGPIPSLPKSIKKVGVFVDAPLETIVQKIQEHDLYAVQLHGNETPGFCDRLMAHGVKIIKVFSIEHTFDFEVLKPYEAVCDYYLFDTKGQLPGGNGYAFNWDILLDYPSSKPFFLSGGIGLKELEKIQAFKTRNISKHCHAIDVNSQFEIAPGLKNTTTIEQFKYELQHRQ